MAWVRAAREEAIGDDEVIGVDLGGRLIAIYRTGGRLYATDNVCTHQFALLSDGYVEDGCIECPLHQGRFEIATGRAMGAPVTEPIRTYKVAVEGGDVMIDLPDP